MKNKAPRKKPAVNRVYYIYVGILAVLIFYFPHHSNFLKVLCTALQTGEDMESGIL